MEDSVIIREFKSEDLDGVMKINRVCLPENYSASFFMEHFWENPRIFLVAEVNGKLAGYNMCRIEFGISNIKLAFVRRGHVISIAVMEDFRRRGIGRMLMEGGMQRVKESGASEIYLEVRQSNVPAIDLYRKLGFKTGKILESYYRDGENAYLMISDLSNINAK